MVQFQEGLKVHDLDLFFSERYVEWLVHNSKRLRSPDKREQNGREVVINKHN